MQYTARARRRQFFQPPYLLLTLKCYTTEKILVNNKCCTGFKAGQPMGAPRLCSTESWEAVQRSGTSLRVHLCLPGLPLFLGQPFMYAESVRQWPVAWAAPQAGPSHQGEQLHPSACRSLRRLLVGMSACFICEDAPAWSKMSTS